MKFSSDDSSDDENEKEKNLNMRKSADKLAKKLFTTLWELCELRRNPKINECFLLNIRKAQIDFKDTSSFRLNISTN